MQKYSYTEVVEEEALKMFDSGITIKNIAKLLNLTKSTARLLIIRNKRKPLSKAAQTQKVKFNPFNLNTEESNYWLGYLLADGWITSKKHSMGITTLSDPNHLKKILNLIPTISILTTNSKYGMKYSIVFTNTDTWNYLNYVGITPKKSKELKLLIPIDKDILRGVFDGDGSISQGIPKITSGSLDFCQQIKDFLEKNNIKSVIGLKDKNKTPCYDIRIKGDGRFLFYKLLYSNATIFLERKENKYRSALKKFRVKNIGLIAGSLPFITEVISSQD